MAGVSIVDGRWTLAKQAKFVKFKWNRDFMVKLRTSPEAFDALQKRGESIANAAGPGHKVTSMVTRGGPNRRARVQITASTSEARRENSKNHALLRALNSGRSG